MMMMTAINALFSVFCKITVNGYFTYLVSIFQLSPCKIRPAYMIPAFHWLVPVVPNNKFSNNRLNVPLRAVMLIMVFWDLIRK